MADVFISYSRDDLSIVAEIASALEQEGLSVWWDPEIVPGTTYDEVIANELAQASVVLVAWSEAANTSRWVREEANDALERGKLIPVRIEKIAPPLGFRLIQTTDLVFWGSDKQAPEWRQLMQRIYQLSGLELGSLAESTDQPQIPDDQKSAPRLDYYELFRPTKFTVMGSVFFGLVRFFREPFPFTFYAVIYLFVPYYLLTYFSQLYWHLLAENINIVRPNFAWDYVFVAVLQTLLWTLLSILSQTIFALKIQAQAIGLKGIINHIGYLYSKRSQVFAASAIVASLLTVVSTLWIVILELLDFIDPENLLLVILILILVTILIIVTGLLYVRYYYGACVAVVSGLNAPLALSRSHALVRGNAFKLLILIMLLVGFYQILLVINFDYYAEYIKYSWSPVTEESVAGLQNSVLADGNILRQSVLLHQIADAIGESRAILALFSTVSTMLISLVLAEAFFQFYQQKNRESVLR